jgi:hypothetical protein
MNHYILDSVHACAEHVNRRYFHGVLAILDQSSDKAPSGARGHKVLLTRSAAENGLQSLLGMALDYSPRLDRHDARRKIGIITSANVNGCELRVSGFLYERDFPEIVTEIGVGTGMESGSG